MEKLLYLLDGEGNASNAAEKLELLKEALDDLETDGSQIAVAIEEAAFDDGFAVGSCGIHVAANGKWMPDAAVFLKGRDVALQGGVFLPRQLRVPGLSLSKRAIWRSCR